MSEWWTYTLADFLMFSSRTYWRLIAQYNEAVWPLHLAVIAAGGIVIWFTGTIQKRRIAMFLLAVAWAWVAWAYHLDRYADISTAAPYFAGAFALQALLLAVLGIKSRNIGAGWTARRTGLVIAGLAVFAYPLLTPLGGRPWNQAEVFSIAPDPTVIATLGILLAARAHWSAWLIPLAWCAVSAATLVELRVAHALLPPAIGVLAMAVSIASRHSSTRLNSTTNSPP